ncbi:acyl-CoA desaturase [Salinisphaera sp. T31B1]|uniref:fatty acid desaturase family protein n=1 Tax=Salinisphaera sp. T31B1 TaxID=727963 RepID=UPI0033409BD0
MTQLNQLSESQIERIGTELDALRKRTLAELGERDARYIRTVIKRQRQFEVAGRVMMMIPPAWPLGVASLSLSKILDNMEIGHNVMHGQYDWMGDPAINSQTFEWDSADTADNWKHTHNYEHHTYTNVVDRDHDIGYGLLRMSEDQPWEPRFLLNLPLTVLLHLFFQHFVAVQNLRLEDYLVYKTKTRAQLAEEFKPVGRKLRRQLAKDYVVFPLLAGPLAPMVFIGNMGANLVRNVWACAVIFNGHFPEDVEQFDESVLDRETRGQWYVRQLLGSANFEGSKLMHLMSGNLSYQIEHHLFPDIPACRYAEMAPTVRRICEDNGLPYHSGSFLRQAASTWKRIARLSLPRLRRRRRTGQPMGESVQAQPLAA